MSYGRQPYYIWADGQNVNFDGRPVPIAAVAQFVTRMCARGNAEIAEWIEYGKALCDDIPDNLTVTVENPWLEPEDQFPPVPLRDIVEEEPE